MNGRASDIIVIPCFNEARRMPTDEIRRSLQQDGAFTICFVDDGSSDGTAELLNGLRGQFPDRVAVVRLPRNCGKAEAVRQGVLQSCRSRDVARVAYFDADLATPFSEYSMLAERLESDERLQMVFGSRVRRLGATVERNPVRHYCGRVIATAVSRQLGLPVYDTQCGAKVFRREICEALFETPFLSRWLFDVEVFHRLISTVGRDHVQEVALEVPLRRWVDRGESKITFTDVVRVPWDLWRIGRHYKRA